MSIEQFDVVVVGARVGGSLLSARLGREGVRVLLAEAGHFPSETLSTHFFRGSGLLKVLDKTGALDEVMALGAPRLVREYSFESGGSTPRVAPAQEAGQIGFNLSARRVTLDAILARRASRTPGVELAERTKAAGLHRTGGAVTGIDFETPQGTRRVRARLVVGADGRHSWVANQVGALVQSTEAGHRGMFYAYFAGYEGVNETPDGPEFSTLGDEVAYVFPSDAGLACIALSTNLETYGWCRADPGPRFRERLNQHLGLTKRLEAATLEGRLWGIGPTPNWVREPAGPGWALVGDSEMHRDPWSGRGMDSAALHADLLADSILRWWNGRSTPEEAGRWYAHERDAVSLSEYHSTVTGSRDLRALAPPAEDA